MKILFPLSLFSLVLFSLPSLSPQPTPEVLATVECFTNADPVEPLVIEVYSNWSPLGATRFLELVEDKFYDNSPLFRVVKGFIVQFGLSLSPPLEKKWEKRPIKDDPNLGIDFDRGYISFAGSGKDSRTSQVFIAYSKEGTQHLGKVPHETPFGRVVSGMEVADRFFDGNGEFSMDMKPWGKGPEQHKIKQEGLPYLRENYPALSYLKDCTIVDSPSSPPLSFFPPQEKTKRERRGEEEGKKSREEERRMREEERRTKQEEREERKRKRQVRKERKW